MSFPKRRLVVTPGARADIRDSLRYTSRQWGTAPARRVPGKARRGHAGIAHLSPSRPTAGRLLAWPASIAGRSARLVLPSRRARGYDLAHPAREHGCGDPSDPLTPLAMGRSVRLDRTRNGQSAKRRRVARRLDRPPGVVRDHGRQASWALPRRAGGNAGSDKPFTRGPTCGRPPRLGAELAEDGGDVVGGGASAYGEDGGDLGVRPLGDEEGKDLALARGQPDPLRVLGIAWPAVGSGGRRSICHPAVPVGAIPHPLSSTIQLLVLGTTARLTTWVGGRDRRGNHAGVDPSPGDASSSGADPTRRFPARS